MAMRHYILMYVSEIGFQQVPNTGTFQSENLALNFKTYNGHLMVDDAGKALPANKVRVLALIDSE